MKKRIFFTCIMVLALVLGPGVVSGHTVNHTLSLSSTNSESAMVVVNAKTGSPLFALNADRQLPPASLTKLMTAILSINQARLSDIVTVGDEVRGIDGSIIGLKPGDRISVENLFYAMLMDSSNEAAAVLAAHTYGSVNNFVSQMNSKATDMGLRNTHFVNPHGLPADDHYSSAKDLAVIARSFLANPFLRKIVSTKTKQITWQRADGSLFTITLHNTNQLLKVYPGIYGMKTGTTTAAGQCLVSYAAWDSGEVIMVLLHSTNRYQDSVKSLDQIYTYLQLQQAGDTLMKNRSFTF